MVRFFLNMVALNLDIVISLGVCMSVLTSAGGVLGFCGSLRDASFGHEDTVAIQCVPWIPPVVNHRPTCQYIEYLSQRLEDAFEMKLLYIVFSSPTLT